MENLNISVAEAINVSVSNPGKLTLSALTANGYKIGFAVGNRPILEKNVKAIKTVITNEGWYDAEHIQLVKAETAIKDGLTIQTIFGDDVTSEDAKDYLIVIDGQHRYLAVIGLNEEFAKGGKPQIDPTVFIVEPNSTCQIYLNQLNLTKKAWNTGDYAQGATRMSDDKMVLRVNELLKDGCPMTTINLIYATKFSATILSSIAQGITKKNNGDSIIPAYNIEKGDEFISTLQKVGFPKSDIYKRYLIDNFKEMVEEVGRIPAIKILSNITPEIKERMYEIGKNNQKKINETKVKVTMNHLLEKIQAEQAA